MAELLLPLLFDLAKEEVDPGVELDHLDVVERLRCLRDSCISLLHQCLLESRASSRELDVYEDANHEDSDTCEEREAEIREQIDEADRKREWQGGDGRELRREILHLLRVDLDECHDLSV